MKVLLSLSVSLLLNLKGWIRCADHVTPLYPQKLALTSPTGGGRSVGIVRSRTKATESVIAAETATRVSFVNNSALCSASFSDLLLK
jgi:hypothetical protein